MEIQNENDLVSVFDVETGKTERISASRFLCYNTGVQRLFDNPNLVGRWCLGGKYCSDYRRCLYIHPNEDAQLPRGIKHVMGFNDLVNLEGYGWTPTKYFVFSQSVKYFSRCHEKRARLCYNGCIATHNESVEAEQTGLNCTFLHAKMVLVANAKGIVQDVSSLDFIMTSGLEHSLSSGTVGTVCQAKSLPAQRAEHHEQTCCNCKMLHYKDSKKHAEEEKNDQAPLAAEPPPPPPRKTTTSERWADMADEVPPAQQEEQAPSGAHKTYAQAAAAITTSPIPPRALTTSISQVAAVPSVAKARSKELEAEDMSLRGEAALGPPARSEIESHEKIVPTQPQSGGSVVPDWMQYFLSAANRNTLSGGLVIIVPPTSQQQQDSGKRQ